MKNIVITHWKNVGIYTLTYTIHHVGKNLKHLTVAGMNVLMSLST